MLKDTLRGFKMDGNLKHGTHISTTGMFVITPVSTTDEIKNI